jgi:hypothetical protein
LLLRETSWKQFVNPGTIHWLCLNAKQIHFILNKKHQEFLMHFANCKTFQGFWRSHKGFYTKDWVYFKQVKSTELHKLKFNHDIPFQVETRPSLV